jgi:hypothetical protein
MLPPSLSSGRWAAVIAATILTACSAETLPAPGQAPAPARMADGVSRADSLAIIEELGGWPPPKGDSVTPAPPPSITCREARARRSLDHGALDGKLDSLQQVALTSDDDKRRIAAVIGVGNAGLLSTEEQVCADVIRPQVRHAGVVARLSSLYRALDDDRARRLIIILMMGQSERGDAVALLGRVVQQQLVQEDRSAALGHARNAIQSLTRMGSQGRGILRRLHEEGSVRDPSTRAYLEELAKRGFRER